MKTMSMAFCAIFLSVSQLMGFMIGDPKQCQSEEYKVPVMTSKSGEKHHSLQQLEYMKEFCENQNRYFMQLEAGKVKYGPSKNESTGYDGTFCCAKVIENRVGSSSIAK